MLEPANTTDHARGDATRRRNRRHDQRRSFRCRVSNSSRRSERTDSVHCRGTDGNEWIHEAQRFRRCRASGRECLREMSRGEARRKTKRMKRLEAKERRTCEAGSGRGGEDQSPPGEMERCVGNKLKRENKKKGADFEGPSGQKCRGFAGR